MLTACAARPAQPGIAPARVDTSLSHCSPSVLPLRSVTRRAGQPRCPARLRRPSAMIRVRSHAVPALDRRAGPLASAAGPLTPPLHQPSRSACTRHAACVPSGAASRVQPASVRRRLRRSRHTRRHVNARLTAAIPCLTRVRGRRNSSPAARRRLRSRSSATRVSRIPPASVRIRTRRSIQPCGALWGLVVVLPYSITFLETLRSSILTI